VIATGLDGFGHTHTVQTILRLVSENATSYTEADSTMELEGVRESTYLRQVK